MSDNNDMVEESDLLIRVVNDLLTLAHADAGRNLTKETVDIRPVIEETCQRRNPAFSAGRQHTGGHQCARFR